MTPWLLVAGDLTPLGGMDRANHALARHLAWRGSEVHLVTHRAWRDLSDWPTVNVHTVWRPFGRHMLGGPLLASAGRRAWRRLSARGVKVVVNGGNCSIAGVNWVHYLHASHTPITTGGRGHRLKTVVAHERDLMAERRALSRARVIICNSERTRQDVLERFDIGPDRVHVVYYGSDEARFDYVNAAGRLRVRRRFGWPERRPLVGFIGALGDRRKAFDVLFEAWIRLCGDPSWDADLVVVGEGSELPLWKHRASAARLDDRVRFLGFRDDVADVLAALDVVVHPARYEAYGLAVHEAICRGVPAIVAASAGVAERYPASLHDLLLHRTDGVSEITERLGAWRCDMASVRDRVATLSQVFRARSWDAMAADIVQLAEAA